MGLIDLVGVDRVCFGSDYPHPEGLADPLSWRDELGDLCGESTRKIMSDNMHDLMGISPAAA